MKIQSRTKSVTTLNQFKKSTTPSTPCSTSKQSTSILTSRTTASIDPKKRNQGKENISPTNGPSSDQKLKNKSFKPAGAPLTRKNSKLSLSNTVSLIINESLAQAEVETDAKNEELLDSLLYGDIDLTYSHDFNEKGKMIHMQQDQDNEQLLIQGYFDNMPTSSSITNSLQVKPCKNLSPIKSISQYSVSENQYKKFVVQKVDRQQTNTVLKFRNNSTNVIHGEFQWILLRRLIVCFSEDPHKVIRFYLQVCDVTNQHHFYDRVREFLFQNGIIFKKSQLADLIDFLSHKLVQLNQDKTKTQFYQSNFQVLLENIFLTQTPSTEASRTLWVTEQVHHYVFEDDDLVPVWRLISELMSEKNQEIQSSFRQSRYCVSMDSSQFLQESEVKRKKQAISVIADWLALFVTQPVTLPSGNTQNAVIDEQQQKMLIRISPPI